MYCKLGFDNPDERGGKLRVSGNRQFYKKLRDIYNQYSAFGDEIKYRFPLIGFDHIDMVDLLANPENKRLSIKDIKKKIKEAGIKGIKEFDCMGYDEIVDSETGELDTLGVCEGCNYFAKPTAKD